MKFCASCGKEINADAVVCVHCGCAAGGNLATGAKPDAPNIGYAILGFLIPIAGLILFIVNKDIRPLEAKSAGKGALISVILGAIASVLYFILLFVLIMMAEPEYYLVG